MATESRQGQHSPYPPPDVNRSNPYPPDPRQVQGQFPPPQHWAGPPPGGYQYPDPSAPHQYQYPPPQPPHHDMHQPPQPQLPDPWRLPPPPMMPQPHGGYAHDPYNRPPPHMAPSYNQPAPRQRTAIACRYCRRRKIRCSGYEGENGKCSNCVRFGQECLFTPVSSSAQTFVPAHVAFPQLRNSQGQAGSKPPQLYGAHGQPLPPEYAQGQAPDQNYPPPGQPYNYQHYPPNSGPAGQASDPRRESGNAYAYPDPTNSGIAPVSPATSVSNYSNAPPPNYYSAPPPQSAPRRASPQSAHSYDNRASDSPQGSSSTLATSSRGQPVPGRTPPPGSSAPGSTHRAGMSVAGMLGGPTGGSPGETNGSSRSTHDHDMLNALDRRNRGSGDERK